MRRQRPAARWVGLGACWALVPWSGQSTGRVRCVCWLESHQKALFCWGETLCRMLCLGSHPWAASDQSHLPRPNPDPHHMRTMSCRREAVMVRQDRAGPPLSAPAAARGQRWKGRKRGRQLWQRPLRARGGSASAHAREAGGQLPTTPGSGGRSRRQACTCRRCGAEPQLLPKAAPACLLLAGCPASSLHAESYHLAGRRCCGVPAPGARTVPAINQRQAPATLADAAPGAQHARRRAMQVVGAAVRGGGG